MSTQRLEMEIAIKNAIAICSDDTGWANLAEIGAELRKMGINYGKLSRFFQDYAHLVELRNDTTVQPPVVYAKLGANV